MDKQIPTSSLPLNSDHLGTTLVRFSLLAPFCWSFCRSMLLDWKPGPVSVTGGAVKVRTVAAVKAGRLSVWAAHPHYNLVLILELPPLLP